MKEVKGIVIDDCKDCIFEDNTIIFSEKIDGTGIEMNRSNKNLIKNN